MIDSAVVMKNELGRFELVYKKELADGMNAIISNCDINIVIKDKLTHKTQTDISTEREIFIGSSPGKEDMRYLIFNLEKLFNVKPVNQRTDQNASIPAEYLFPTLS